MYPIDPRKTNIVHLPRSLTHIDLSIFYGTFCRKISLHSSRLFVEFNAAMRSALRSPWLLLFKILLCAYAGKIIGTDSSHNFILRFTYDYWYVYRNIEKRFIYFGTCNKKLKEYSKCHDMKCRYTDEMYCCRKVTMRIRYIIVYLIIRELFETYMSTGSTWMHRRNLSGSFSYTSISKCTYFTIAL